MRAIVSDMPDPAVLSDRACRIIHLSAAVRSSHRLCDFVRCEELTQLALRSHEIVTALRESIATSESSWPASCISITTRSRADSI